MKDNITDWALRRYRTVYKDKTITKEDIFYYTYGMLHHSGYRDKYAASLVRGLPHIPLAPNFRVFCEAGKKLADLHLNYETCPRFDLGEPLNPIPNNPRSISFAKGGDQSTIFVNNTKIYDDLPNIRYKVNGRTPVGWLTAPNYFRKSKAGIDRYPFRVFTGAQIRALMERLVYVGIESDKIINGLPVEFKMDDLEPEPAGLDRY